MDRRTLTAGLDRHVLLVAMVVVVGAIMSILDTTIVNVALKTIGHDLHASLHTIQWIITGYLLALATVIPTAGWLTERFGARRVWMSAVTVFGISSVLCGLSWSVGSLIVFRVIQGFGGGLIMPVGTTVLAQAAGPQRMGRAMSVLGVPILLGPTLGPVIGGLIVDNVTWRVIFFVNVPVVILGLFLARRLLAPDAGAADAGRLDWRGLLLLSPGVALVTFGLSEVASAGGIGAFSAWFPIALGLVLLAAFVHHGLRRAERPIVDLRLFRRPQFSAAATTTFAAGAALFGVLLVLPLYFQTARGESPLDTGLLLVPQGIGAACTMPVAGRLTDRIGAGRIALVGLALMLGGTAMLTQIGGATSYAYLDGALFLRGLGLGATMMPVTAAAYAAIDSDAVPRATSVMNVLRRIGGSIGTALLTVVLTRSATGGGGSVHAFATTFWWAFGLTVLAALPALALARSDRRQRQRAADEPATTGPPREPGRPRPRRPRATARRDRAGASSPRSR